MVLEEPSVSNTGANASTLLGLPFQLLFLLFALFTYSIFAKQIKLTDTEVERLSQKIETELEKQDAPGIAYAITYDGKNILTGSKGYSNIKEKKPFFLQNIYD